MDVDFYWCIFCIEQKGETMIINPIIPVWAMAIICIGFLFLKRKGKINYVRQILIILLLFVINLRIMVKGGDVPQVSTKVDVLFVVDNTISMLAEDYNGNGRRMDAVKEDCKYITEQFPVASFSVVTFGNSVQSLTPYTVDTNMVIDTIGVLSGQPQLHASGTSLNEVMEAMEGVLKNNRDTYKILFFITDGEIINSEDLKSYKGLKQYVDAGAVLGYGTTTGGPMKTVEYLEDESETEYLYYYDDNYDKQQAISKIDENNLKSIASDFGIDYVHMTDQSQIHKNIKELQNKVNKLELDTNTDSKKGYVDIYYLFVIPLVLLMIMDYIYYKKKGQL